jgi:hypothetical protein
MAADDLPSSRDLHPVAGARFVCERAEGPELVYRVAVHTAGGHTHHAELRWDAAGHASATPAHADAWAHAELLKLARVLKHSQQDRLTRWRGP